jgi:O-antigen/teichoic acid export membrane protein
MFPQGRLFAHYVGNGWTAAMAIVFLPRYLEIMGSEAFGVVAFFASLQVWLLLLDMGFPSTMTRELSRSIATTSDEKTFATLLRTVEVLLLAVVILIIAVGFILAAFLSSFWFKAAALDSREITAAAMWMVLAIAIRLHESVYRSCVQGLQKDYLLNAAAVVLSTIRWGGAWAAISAISPSIQTFACWQAFSSLISLLLYRLIVYASLPRLNVMASFSWSSLRRVRIYAGSLSLVGVLSIILTQTDKLLLSKTLPLGEFGNYGLACALAGGLFALAAPIGQFFFPKLCRLYAEGKDDDFSRAYHLAAQTVSVVVGGVAVVAIMLSKDITYLWLTGDGAASAIYPIMQLMIIGNLLNALASMPYHAQLAAGWAVFALRMNMVAVVMFVPLLFVLVPKYGAMGAAWLWVALNIGYLVSIMTLMYRRILCGHRLRWMIGDICLPIGVAILSFGVVDIGCFALGRNIGGSMIAISVALVVCICASALAASEIRSIVYLKLVSARGGE